ncbi:helix-turn-helix transcriptional regulator [Phreatobacter sp. AB_2022a]|uniref:helix-turn-helix transcriptional regulator n=1 Tax=Phreatobacter sp. AB_2022a TaxID=3003134 RepID=UPI00228764A7|nr:LuxR family transcriptional regulator [Phreatobacter sp. AB_2022a]MCZ0733304.1 LuxR C-terminal-related transcriptional regulator [Phreatobacter sp. AB_2022a]
MTSAFVRALDLASGFETAATAEAVGRQFIAAIRPLGARTLFAGSFPILPEWRLDDIVAGRRVLAQFAAPGWIEGYSQRGLDRKNPVIFAPLRRTGSFRWSAPGFADLDNWAGLGLCREMGIEDGLAVPCHGPGGRVGVISIGFERFDLDPPDRRAVGLAAGMAFERMQALAPPAAAARAGLTPRERDCLAFVAEGLSDADIAGRLGISPVTAHAHVENAKRKLGARTRAQAVARLHIGRWL